MYRVLYVISIYADQIRTTTKSSNHLFISIFSYVYVCVLVGMCTWVKVSGEARIVGFSGVGAKDGCEPSNMNAGN